MNFSANAEFSPLDEIIVSLVHYLSPSIDKWKCDIGPWVQIGFYKIEFNYWE